MLGLGLAGAGCGKGKDEPGKAREATATTPAPSPTPPPPPADAPGAPADTGPPADAEPPADAGLATTPWPTSIESSEYARGKLKPLIDKDHVEIPRFRTQPPELGEELNARLAKYAKPDPARKVPADEYRARCHTDVLSRFAVVIYCEQSLEAADPKVDVLRLWLQPGLPPIELDQVAPGADAAKAIARDLKRASAECRTTCKTTPAGFTLNRYGVVFPPLGYCEPCDKLSWPQIPLAEMKPTHPWAVELVDWVRKRAKAGYSMLGGGEKDL
jgi:hypothetical protein